MRIMWITQATEHQDGWIIDEDACWLAELKLLKQMGCSETDKARLIRVEVIGYGESLTSAYVTAHMARFLFTYTDAEDAIAA